MKIIDRQDQELTILKAKDLISSESEYRYQSLRQMQILNETMLKIAEILLKNQNVVPKKPSEEDEDDVEYESEEDEEKEDESEEKEEEKEEDDEEMDEEDMNEEEKRIQKKIKELEAME